MTSFFKALQMHQENSKGALSHERGTHTECWKNYEIPLLALLTRKSNDQLCCSNFGSNSPLYGAKLRSNAREVGEDGRFFNWPVQKFNPLLCMWIMSENTLFHLWNTTGHTIIPLRKGALIHALEQVSKITKVMWS